MKTHWKKVIMICMGLMLLALPATLHAQDSKIEKEILELVNKYRSKKGREALKPLEGIATEAQTHSNRMASGKIPHGHDGFDGRYDRLHKKYPRMTGCAENVAYGAKNAKAAVDMWLGSKGHKKNIKGDYTHTGIGVARNKKGTLYYTQIFVKMQE